MTDSQYLALIEVSEDQGTIECDGVTFVAVDYAVAGNACRHCALWSIHDCFGVECISDRRADGRDVIFVVKSND